MKTNKRVWVGIVVAIGIVLGVMAISTASFGMRSMRNRQAYMQGGQFGYGNGNGYMQPGPQAAPAAPVAPDDQPAPPRGQDNGRRGMPMQQGYMQGNMMAGGRMGGFSVFGMLFGFIGGLFRLAFTLLIIGGLFMLVRRFVFGGGMPAWRGFSGFGGWRNGAQADANGVPPHFEEFYKRMRERERAEEAAKAAAAPVAPVDAEAPTQPTDVVKPDEPGAAI